MTWRDLKDKGKNSWVLNGSTSAIFILMLFLLLYTFLYALSQSKREIKELNKEILEKDKNATLNIFICINNCSYYFEDIVRDDKVMCAFYNINDPKILKHLYTKLLIIDTHNYEGIGKAYYSEGIMHHKFCLNDQELITGSYNPVISPIEMLNIIIKSDDKDIINIFKVVFNEMYYYPRGEKHNKKGIEENPHKVYKFKNLMLCFTPNKICRDLILKYLEKAKHSIDIYEFTLTDPAIIYAIVKKSSRGVKINGIVSQDYGSFYEKILFRYVKRLCCKKIIHAKIIIIDKKILIVGSYNPSKNAYTRNEEVLIIYNISQETAINIINKINEFIT